MKAFMTSFTHHARAKWRLCLLAGKYPYGHTKLGEAICQHAIPALTSVLSAGCVTQGRSRIGKYQIFCTSWGEDTPLDFFLIFCFDFTLEWFDIWERNDPIHQERLKWHQKNSNSDIIQTVPFASQSPHSEFCLVPNITQCFYSPA